MNVTDRIFIAGHNGMVGSTMVNKLNEQGFHNIIKRNHRDLDLRNQSAVQDFFQTEKPDYVILAAAKVGGIMANIESPASFMYDNLMIQNNIINSAYECNVKKLMFLASSCIYPRLAPQPMKEEYLLDGKVEPTNEGYAIAKIAGLKLCEMYNRQYGTDYISVMPCNLYGIGDDFHPTRSHVVAGLIRKFHEGKINSLNEVVVWGTGQARRELLFTKDLADACFYLLQNYSGNDFFNIGSGFDVSIKELAEMIKHIVGYQGEIRFDKSKPDGMPQKLMDNSKILKTGWTPKVSLESGIEQTYHWYLENINKFEEKSNE